MATFERIVLVKKKTPLQELLDRHYSRGQVEFYLNSRGLSIGEYDITDRLYHESFNMVVAGLPITIPHLEIFREDIATFQFRSTDLIIVVGPDGLCVNVAKYAYGQPILAVNPDQERIDGKLTRFLPNQVGRALSAIVQGQYEVDELALAQATTNDGQVLYAVNDFLVGRRDQVSARYTIEHNGYRERQSSSGILISTGVGSSGWLTSVLTGAAAIAAASVRADFSTNRTVTPRPNIVFPWDANYLLFAVREPFPSQYTKANLVTGRIEEGNDLTVTSEMPEHGVIFSDGVLEDAIEFNSGSIVSISVADRSVWLIRT